jgi:hypothetical protein
VNDDRTATIPKSAQDIGMRASEVAERLRAHLLEVAREVGGPSFRPSRLVETLGIDKSLASRISRSLRSDAPYEVLHLLPSPTGLGIFLDGVERHGCAPNVLRRARAAVAAFQDLLREIPGGRAALDALMSETVVEVRERAERTASQTVYRAMSYLLGYRCETITSAVILQPSADGKLVDGLEVGRREGIRRLRPNAPAALFSANLAKNGPPEAPAIEMLGEGANPHDPRSVLLPEFCDPHEPSLELHESGQHTIFALSDGDRTLQRAVTISSAFFVRGAYLRWRTEEQEEEFRLYLLHYPCKLLIRDLFIHEDLYVGSEPQVRLEFPAPPGAPRPGTKDPAARLNRLDISTPIVSLGRGLHHAPAAGASQHAKLLAHVFRTAGLDPERFRGYRARIMYPVPMITMGWWIPLPSAP